MNMKEAKKLDLFQPFKNAGDLSVLQLRGTNFGLYSNREYHGWVEWDPKTHIFYIISGDEVLEHLPEEIAEKLLFHLDILR